MYTANIQNHVIRIIPGFYFETRDESTSICYGSVNCFVDRGRKDPQQA